MECINEIGKEIIEQIYQATEDAFEEVVFDKFQCLPSEEEIFKSVSVIHDSDLGLKPNEFSGYRILYKGTPEFRIRVVFNKENNRLRISKERVVKND
jgi:hypothetical protein